MVQLFSFLRDKFGTTAPAAPRPPGFVARVPVDDFHGGRKDGHPIGESVSGMTVIFDYRDSRGAESRRQVSCIRIESQGGTRYLRAFCHTRTKQRLFRLDRIELVSDAVTGELLTDGPGYFGDFADDRVSTARYGWGLSVQKRAMLGAGLTVLTFLSRCDGQMHPAEIDEIETFAAAWWMRAGPDAAMPEADIYDHARKLARDVEAFVLAAERVRGCATTGPLVTGYARRLVEADGRISPEEHHWITKLIKWWAEA